jgi:hypothetical protein
MRWQTKQFEIARTGLFVSSWIAISYEILGIDVELALRTSLGLRMETKFPMKKQFGLFVKTLRIVGLLKSSLRSSLPFLKIKD